MEEPEPTLFIAYRAAAFSTALRNVPHDEAQRFNKIGDDPVQYLSLHPLGPWAERLRSSNLKTPGLAREMRVRIWALRVGVERYLDLSFDRAASDSSLGLEPNDLVSDDHGACQEFGKRLLADPDSPRTLRVPSAALPGTHNLVIFGVRVETFYLDEPIDEAIEIPTSIVGESAQPLIALLPYVRFYGDPHAGLDAWQQGVSFEFDQPLAPSLP